MSVRLVSKCAVLVAVLWTLYWFAAGYGIRSGLTEWFNTQRDAGWQADYADLSTSGYPVNIRTIFDQPALADPATGVAWQAEKLILSSPAWWPGHVTLTFPDTPQRLSYFDQTLILTTNAARADLRLKPGTNLELQELSLHAGPWILQRDQDTLLGGADLIVSALQNETPSQYRFEISANAFQPGDIPRKTMRLPASWPVTFDALDLDMTVTFERAWDRRAIEDARPQPRSISIKVLEIKWGDLRLFAAGKVTLDASGVPTGTIAVKADNWRDILNLAEQSGRLPSEIRNTAENVLSMLAGLNGNSQTLDVDLTLRDGFIALGPLPIAAAPRIILR